MSINKAIIIGRLGKDPAIKYLPTGVSVCEFSVATSETWTDKDGKKQEKTEWHSISTFAKLADVCNQYLKKGSMCYLEGRLQTRSWVKDGATYYKTEIVADKVEFLSPKKADAEDIQENITADDIPF